MPNLRVAVIGLGEIGQEHLTRWADVSGADILSVCDLNAGIATGAATEFGCEAHTDWQAAISVSGVNVVDICTPNSSHKQIALAALKGRKDVLCEAPMGQSLEDASAIVKAADTNERILMSGFCQRFHPLVVFAKELIDNDDLGKICMFRCRFSSHAIGIGERWVSDKEVSGGGALLYLGSHAIDLFRYLVGEVSHSSGYTATFDPRLNIEDSAIVSLRAENGLLGTVEVSWNNPGGRNVLELYGSAGVCLIDYDASQVRFKSADMMVWETKEASGPDRYQREISHFADVVRGIQEPIISSTDGLRAMKIVDAIYLTERV